MTLRSEVGSQCKLNYPWRVELAGHLSEPSCDHVIPVRIGITEYDTVEGIEEVGAELNRARSP